MEHKMEEKKDQRLDRQDDHSMDHQGDQRLDHQGDHAMQKHHYRNLAIMGVLSFISMYVLMYAMVDRFSNVFNHLNQVYMAGLMTAPMMVFEVLLMKAMYKKKNWNAAIIAGSILVGILLFVFIRQQTVIGDTQFIRSMIPHHSGAILMCERANLSDPELVELCEEIVQTQEEEIAQMRAILERLGQ
jgi:uncharacterized protein (DUF305 family)